MGKYKKEAGIYQIMNIINRKVYIGYTTTINKRWANHRNRLRANKHKNEHLQQSWNLHGEDKFKFSILEKLPQELSKSEYEAIETRWVLHFNSHKNEFGYNSVLPGSFPIKENGGNKTKNKSNKKKPVIIINCKNNEITEIESGAKVQELYNLSGSKLQDYLNYWRGKSKRKSYKGFIFVRKEDYIEGFDYSNYKKIREKKSIKTWRDYEKTRKRNKHYISNINPPLP